ncbi:MAG: hypothetical protein KatS3mg057_0711 [Herpetosiphonaceae bacterium]|nr:MAG: hypothetical protein KatS3mg057_0711 [Herpetosiphonaceae bacterium]
MQQAHSPRVLIIDDEIKLALKIERYLKETGLQATAVPDGAQGLELLATQQWDVVLTDLGMPGVDGYAVLQTVQEQYPELPVVVITAHGDLSAAVRALQLGAYDYLLKPIDLTLIRAAIDRALQQRELRRIALAHRQLEAITQLAWTAAHEINNPLTSAMGFIQLVLHEQRDSAVLMVQRRDLLLILEDLERIRTVVNRLTHLERIVTREAYIGSPIQLIDLDRSSAEEE